MTYRNLAKKLKPVGQRFLLMLSFPFLVVGGAFWLIVCTLPCWLLTGRDVDDQLEWAEDKLEAFGEWAAKR